MLMPAMRHALRLREHSFESLQIAELAGWSLDDKFGLYSVHYCFSNCGTRILDSVNMFVKNTYSWVPAHHTEIAELYLKKKKTERTFTNICESHR